MDHTVLVCDNEEPLRALIVAALAPLRCRVEQAADGDQALERIRSTAPDLVLLDMMMPGKTGLEVLAEVRRDSALCDVPVVMLTARTQVADQEAFAAAGADCYVAKPFSPAKLLLVVEDLLANGRRRAA